MRSNWSFFLVLPLTFVFHCELASAQALPSDDSGISAATEICEKTIDHWDREACRKTIARSSYFNKKAVSLCNYFTTNLIPACLGIVADSEFDDSVTDLCDIPFSDFKNSCIKAMANRSYRKESLQQCKNLGDVSLRIKCLKDLGQRASPVSREGIRSAISALRAGNNARALEILESLLQ